MPAKGNMDNLFMHLTNYAINKNSDNFEKNEDENDADAGHKRSVTSIFKLIEENHPEQKAEKLWTQIEDICTKTIICAGP